MPTIVSHTIEQKIRVALRARSRDGVGAVVRLLGRSAVDRLVRSAGVRRHADFDRRHGVDTAGAVAISELDHAGSRYDDGIPYGTAPIQHLESIFRALATQIAVPPRAFTFIDLGCGKGLPVLLAAQHGFASVIGVELDSGLAEIARRNAAALATEAIGLTDAIEIVVQDAVKFEFPLHPTVLFMSNPFGARTLNDVLERAVDSVTSHPRPFFVVYCNEVHREVCDARPELTVVRRTVRWSVYSVDIGAASR